MHQCDGRIRVSTYVQSCMQHVDLITEMNVLNHMDKLSCKQAHANRESNYGGMTPHAVALLIRADPSFKYVSAARQGLKRGGTCGRACK